MFGAIGKVLRKRKGKTFRKSLIGKSFKYMK